MRLRAMVVSLLLLASCKEAVVQEVTVAEAAQRLKSGAAVPVDANTDDYRDAVGWIPGAVLLTAFNEYSFAELPADKNQPLIFYCTSRM